MAPADGDGEGQQHPDRHHADLLAGGEEQRRPEQPGRPQPRSGTRRAAPVAGERDGGRRHVGMRQRHAAGRAVGRDASTRRRGPPRPASLVGRGSSTSSTATAGAGEPAVTSSHRPPQPSSVATIRRPTAVISSAWRSVRNRDRSRERRQSTHPHQQRPVADEDKGEEDLPRCVVVGVEVRAAGEDEHAAEQRAHHHRHHPHLAAHRRPLGFDDRVGDRLGGGPAPPMRRAHLRFPRLVTPR